MVRIREDKKRYIREDEEDMTLQDSIVYGLEQEGVAAHVVDEGKDFGVMIDGSNIFITWDVGYFDMNSGRCPVFFLAYDRDTNTKIYDGEKVTEMYDAILDYGSFSDDMFESKKHSKTKALKESEGGWETPYKMWLEKSAPNYDVSNADAYFAGAKFAGCDATDEDYKNWLEQYAPNYDVSNYDAFEGGVEDGIACQKAADPTYGEEDEGDYYDGPATDTRYVSGCCSMCGSSDNVNTLENFLTADGYDVEQACDILGVDPLEEVCKECYDSWKEELNQKMYSEYNDLGTDTLTGEPFGESVKKGSAKALYEKCNSRMSNLKKHIRIHEGTLHIVEPEIKGPVTKLDGPVFGDLSSRDARIAAEKEIDNFLSNPPYDIWVDNVECYHPETEGFKVTIRGDWKHDHLAADQLLWEKFHLTCIGSDIIEGDGTDYYTAVHQYVNKGIK